MDPNGSCRIRRARGKLSDEVVTYWKGLPNDGIGLPNNSGWMKDEDVKRYSSKATPGTVKKEFRKQYPEYADTIYPIGNSKATQSVWSLDPNNSKNSIAISNQLPMPPDKSATYALPQKASPGKTNQRKTKDKTYVDDGAKESEDEEPEPGDVQNDLPQSDATKKRKKKLLKIKLSKAAEPSTSEPPATTAEPTTAAEPPATPSMMAATEDSGATQGTETKKTVIKIVNRRT